ncbi:unnamed protein product, partial [marine sediment metagenome]
MVSNQLCSKIDTKGGGLYEETIKKRSLPRGKVFKDDNFLYFNEISTPLNFQRKFLNIISALQDWDILYFFSPKKIAVIDIETTGLVPRSSLILEIGIIELDIETGETKVLFDSLI